MDLFELIARYGYGAVAIGCLLEGEAVLLLAGFAAHRAYLDFAGVVAVATVAGFAGDLFFFWLGRRHGPALLARWPSLARQREKVDGWIGRYRAAVIIAVRFTYGFRIAGPVVIGMSSTPVPAFVMFNALGALLWASLFTSLGWFFGEAAQRTLGHMHHLEKWLALGLFAAGLLYGAFRWWQGRR
ncbi:DedA family protein [Ottowia thiooxydans]|uniref:DedA family protein n=1 Tax=Ottowia thiooxydans TaxID=219182 RepID=UPI0004156E95|nr:DedA family protein [Ottowia thiooxydans]